MTYSELYFQKPIIDLAFDDIENFFKEEREESDKIEFKSFTDDNGANIKDKENTILKTICGFLNSEGGIIVWGAPKGSPNPIDEKHKIFIGELTPMQKFYEKDKFINKTTDTITPSPNAIQFQGLQKNGQWIYIIEVAQSPYSPHQFQSIYWMRLDGQTVKAPHHYIEALFKKISFPKLEGYIKIMSINKSGVPADFTKNRYTIVFQLFVFNQSKIQNEYDLTCRVLINKGDFRMSLNNMIHNVRYPTTTELNLPNVKSILFYGEAFQDEDTIRYEPFISEENPTLQILFFFGGKTSPLMLSTYNIALKDIDATKQYSNMVIEKMENKYLHDISRNDITERQKTNIILGLTD
jgi:hypothetical protein